MARKKKFHPIQNVVSIISTILILVFAYIKITHGSSWANSGLIMILMLDLVFMSFWYETNVFDKFKKQADTFND